MYSSKPAIIYGFHGTDRQIAMDVVTQKQELRASNNTYDWLGPGVYFWENNYERAKQYAVESSQRRFSSIKEPAVLGSVIELGSCFDLLDQKYIDFLGLAYRQLKEYTSARHLQIPENHNFGRHDFDFKARRLDCAVIRFALRLASDAGEQFDSIRAAFLEGKPLYGGAGFRNKNHIQIAVLNPNCIKGVFLPREKLAVHSYAELGL